MATSSIRNENKNIFVNDSQLGDWIKAITDTFDNLIAQDVDIKWLLLECDQWCEIYENFPPGLKDIELDNVLSDNDRKALFISLLETVINKADSKGYDLPVAKEISSKLLKELFGVG